MGTQRFSRAQKRSIGEAWMRLTKLARKHKRDPKKLDMRYDPKRGDKAFTVGIQKTVVFTLFVVWGEGPTAQAAVTAAEAHAGAGLL